MSWAALIPVVGKLLDKVLPDTAAKNAAAAKLLEMQQTGALAELDADLKMALAQMEVNKVEAASSHWFVAAWRPATGWVCVSALAWQFLLHPTLQWATTLTGSEIQLPSADITSLIAILTAMLGMGTMRSIDKANKVDTRGIT